MTLGPTDFELLKRLHAFGPEGVSTVTELARRLKVSTPYLSTRLRRLEREGWVERREEKSPRGRSVAYLPRPGVAVQWISRAEGTIWWWQTSGEVNWRFPLVSQVPDEEARRTIIAFLRQLRADQLLDARVMDSGKRGEATPVHHGLSILVFGSTARGRARPGADVDLLVLYSLLGAIENIEVPVRDCAADVSLSAGRTIQVSVQAAESFLDEQGPVAEWIRRDGLIVYDGLEGTPSAPSKVLWQMVYGGRSLE